MGLCEEVRSEVSDVVDLNNPTRRAIGDDLTDSGGGEAELPERFRTKPQCVEENHLGRRIVPNNEQRLAFVTPEKLGKGVQRAGANLEKAFTLRCHRMLRGPPSDGHQLGKALLPLLHCEPFPCAVADLGEGPLLQQWQPARLGNELSRLAPA